MHGVFPSNCITSASSQKVQFHQENGRDSKEVVTPFMQVGTYPTRNFATLGPLWLQPPFAGIYIQNFYIKKIIIIIKIKEAFICFYNNYNFFYIIISPFYLTAPGRCQTLYLVITLCRVLCFC